MKNRRIKLAALSLTAAMIMSTVPAQVFGDTTKEAVEKDAGSSQEAGDLPVPAALSETRAAETKGTWVKDSKGCLTRTDI